MAQSELPPADLVTLRAVEQFDSVLPLAAQFVAPTGRLALLIGSAQVLRAHQLLPNWSWQPPLVIPKSAARVVLTGVQAS